MNHTTSPKPSFDQLLSTIESRERSTRWRTLLWTIVPAFAAFALLSYSSWRLGTATEQVAALDQTASKLELEVAELRKSAETGKAQIRNMKSEVASLRAQLNEAERQLQDTLDLSQFRHPVGMVALKSIASRYPEEARVLRKILELRQNNVGWRLGGQTPAAGFDSPSFAAYILREFDLPGVSPVRGESLIADSRRLFQTLRPTNSPKVGDLAFYPAGYVMFYFMDERDEPFVIGMTPVGIASLKPDFASVIGYRRAQLR